uniref:Uncharacterized protein n=1 Tax=Peronospora matthiolae TaxID=2874970 RepID=A0AAV1TS58_9STRA
MLRRKASSMPRLAGGLDSIAVDTDPSSVSGEYETPSSYSVKTHECLHDQRLHHQVIQAESLQQPMRTSVAVVSASASAQETCRRALGGLARASHGLVNHAMRCWKVDADQQVQTLSQMIWDEYPFSQSVTKSD